MARVKPFRGIRYNNAKFHDQMSRLVAPPYDVIDDEQLSALYESHINNIVRMDLNRPGAQDQSDNNKYTRARRYLMDWLAEGDLIIGGQAIPLDASQREKVLAFREQLVEVAAGGADIGIQGASLATKALGDAAAAIASGEAAGLEARIEADADAIRDAAQALCNRIPELRAARDALVAAVPEFAPYAALDKNDLGNCHVEA